MSKFKVGDEVRMVRDVDNFVNCHGKDTAIIECVDGGAIRLIGGIWWHAKNFELADPWTIYTNTKPMSELSDEQAAELFNWWRKNPESRDAVEGHDNINVSNSTWFPDAVYRAKQKSERELFIDAAFNTCPVFVDTKYDHEQLLNAMFNAGFKAPKVG